MGVPKMMHREGEPQTRFEGWAVVELMGHQREAGYVTTEYFGAACLFRIDTPELPEREFELRRPQYAKKEGSSEWVPKGSKVRRTMVPAKSRLVGVSSIYALNPCTEETARIVIEELIERPLILLELPTETKTPLLQMPPQESQYPAEGDPDWQEEDEVG